MAGQIAVVDDAATAEPWRDELAREISEDAADGVASHVPSILLDLLTRYSGDDSEAAREAARRIDEDYQKVYLPSDPLLRGEDDKGMAGFLSRLYDLVLLAATLVDYDDARQDALVQLLVELRKLPPKAFRIWDEDCLVYTKEPVFAVTTEDRWNGNFPNVSSRPHLDNSEKAAVKQRCDAWINFSTFLARCTAEGLNDHYDDRYKHPSVDIPLGLGLDGDLPPGELGSCRLMVAVQWILHCGRRLRTDMVRSDHRNWNLDRWNRWMAKLKEIEEGDIENAKVKAAVGTALVEMAGLAS